MLEEVQRLGFYSAWNDIRKQVEAYPADQLLLVADADEVYGENWFICLTEEAKERYLYVRYLTTRLRSRGARNPLTAPPLPLLSPPPLPRSPTRAGARCGGPGRSRGRSSRG